MKRLMIFAALLALFSSPVSAEPVYPAVSKSGQIRALPVGDTVRVNASTTSAASINIPPGTAPTSPVNGDCWTTTSGLFCRINGSTQGPFSDSGGGGTVTSVNGSGGTTGLTFSGGPVTSSGTLTLSGTLDVDNGGTGATTPSAARTSLGLAIGTDVQAYDPDLANIASLSTTSFGRGFLTQADAAAARSYIGAGTGTGDLVSTNNLSDVANTSTARSNLGLAIGTNVQAYDAELAAIAGTTSAANKLPYFTGSGTATTTDFTAVGRSFAGAASDAIIDLNSIAFGTAAHGGYAYVFTNTDTTDTAPGGFGFESSGATNGGFIGGGLVHGRIVIDQYGSPTGYEFTATPYVGTNKIFHAGNLTGGDIPNITESQVTNLVSDLAGKQAADADLTTYAGITPSANVQTLLGSADYAAFRSNLGLGTAALKNTGTSGNTVPLLDGTNTWSATQTFGTITPTLISHTSIGNGTDYATFSNTVSTFEGLWFKQASPSASNYTLLGDGVDTYVNAPSSHNLYLRVGNTTQATINSSSATFTGSISASNLSGTNTGDQFTSVTASRVLGRNSGSAGAAQELTLSNVLDLVGSAAQGDILYRGASGWTRLPAGTAGYVLQTNGGSADPAWASSPTVAISPLTAVATATASSNVIDIQGLTLTPYDMAQLDLSDIVLSGNGTLLLQFYVNGSLISTGYWWTARNDSTTGTDAATQSTSASNINLTGSNSSYQYGSAAGNSIGGVLNIADPAGSNWKSIAGLVGYKYAANWGLVQSNGALENTGAITGFRLTSSVNITGGRMTVLARKHTGGDAFNGAKVRKASNLTAQNLTGAPVVITWDTEDWDTNSYHSTVSNTDRMLVPSAGYYQVNGDLYTANTASGNYIYIEIRRYNSSNVQQEVLCQGMTGIAAAGTFSANCTSTGHFNTGDYVSAYGFSGSDTSVDITTQSYLEVRAVG